MNVYLNNTCTRCGHKGATASGLCLECTKSKWLGAWVRRSTEHTIEHKVRELQGGMVVTNCGKRIPTYALVEGTAAPDSNNRCVSCEKKD